LYGSILEAAFPDKNDDLKDVRYIIGTIVAVDEPCTQTGLDSLLGLGDEAGSGPVVLPGNHFIYPSSSKLIISSLASILRTGMDGRVHLHHPSLYDFLTVRADPQFRIDLLKQKEILAFRCLVTMNSRLKFNICNVQNASLLNTEVEDLPDRIKDYLPDALRYSCRFFAHHLADMRDLDGMVRNAWEEFVSKHLLHWMEAMSWLGQINETETSLRVLAAWMKKFGHGSANIKSLIDDAIPFLRNFGQVVRLCALHTYHSALPLTPQTTRLFESFVHDIPHLAPDITSSHGTWPTVPVRVMEGHTHSVNHVMFSPDGKKLASGSKDNTVRLWDGETGQTLGSALKGHTGPVSHIMFSPDGKKLVSGSWDKTVRLWDVETGQTLGSALEGHTGSVSHVMFSPDGKKLGCRDGPNLRISAQGSH
jgi:WD40 repeat protein